MENKKVDFSKLPPELQNKIQKWEANKPANKQLEVIGDIASMVQEMISLSDNRAESMDEHAKAFGALLSDAREQLVKLNDKEAPEQKDFSKPIVDVVEKLAKAFESKDYSPTIKVEAPKVTVPKPEVSVNVAPSKIDVSKIESILKNDVPKAFADAINKMPVPEQDDSAMLERLDLIAEWLQNIDAASRIKPTAPNQMKVTNLDGSPIGGGLTDAELRAAPVEVAVQSDTYSAVAVDATASGNNTIVAITNTARLYYVSLSANGANSADVTAIVKIGASEKFKVSLKAGSIFARNIGAGRRYLTGSAGDDIIVNLSAAQTVHVSVEYED